MVFVGDGARVRVSWGFSSLAEFVCSGVVIEAAMFFVGAGAAFGIDFLGLAFGLVFEVPSG